MHWRVPAARPEPGRRHPPVPPVPIAAGPDRDRGSVTVEAALALCSLAVFLALAVGAIAVAAASVRCIDAARELARLAARGEPGRGQAVAAQVAPAGARITLTHQGDLVIADVSAAVLRPLPVRIGGHAAAAVEPGAVSP